MEVLFFCLELKHVTIVIMMTPYERLKLVYNIGEVYCVFMQEFKSLHVAVFGCMYMFMAELWYYNLCVGTEYLMEISCLQETRP